MTLRQHLPKTEMFQKAASSRLEASRPA